MTKNLCVFTIVDNIFWYHHGLTIADSINKGPWNQCSGTVEHDLAYGLTIARGPWNMICYYGGLLTRADH